MKRFIVTWTDDFYSGGPSVSGGFVGDFDSLEEALKALRRRGHGACTAADILDQELRIVYPITEGRQWKGQKLRANFLSTEF